MVRQRSRKGAALILSMIFVALFAALGVAIAGMSGTNAQLAWNQQQLGRALTTAHSGLDVVRYYLQGITIPVSVAPADRLQFFANRLQTKLVNAGVTNVTVSYDAATETITIPSVIIDSQLSRNFSATIGSGNAGGPGWFRAQNDP